MITSLTIRNFQKHEYLRLVLDPHITTIVGPTDAGKSAVRRALQWVSLNTPRGTNFLRDGAAKVQVTVRTDEDKVVRSKGVANTYSLNGTKFHAFGNDVPAPVQEALNLRELNFQGQFDPAYWLTSSPAEVSRQLNEIVDLGLIDTTLANLAKGLRKTRTEFDITRERYYAAKAERLKLKPAKKVARDFARIEALATSNAKGCLRRSLLAELVEKVATHTKTASRLAAAAQEGRRVLQIGDRWTAVLDRTVRLDLLLEEGRKAEVVRARELPDLAPAEKAAKDLARLQGRLSSLVDLTTSGRRYEEILSEYQGSIEDASEEFKNEMGTTCGLCGQRIRS